MRTMLRLFAVIFMLGICAAARADSFTYNFTFTPTTGTAAGGTGYVTINGTLGSGIQNFTFSNVTALDFNINSYDFKAFGKQSGLSFTFDNGVLESMTYAPPRAVMTPGLTITGLTYTYTAVSTQAITTGSVAGMAPTPEPNSLLLVGTGLAGLAGYARKRLLSRNSAAQSETITA